MTNSSSLAQTQVLTRQDLKRLLAPHVRGISDAFDLHARRESGGIAVQTAAVVDDIVLLLIEHAQPAIVDVIAAGRNLQPDAVRTLGGIDQMISFMQIVSDVFPGRAIGEVGTELVVIIAAAASESSAVASGGRRH